MGVTYQEEAYCERLVEQMAPLLEAHKHELCVYDDFELKPDWDGYLRLWQASMLRIFTARDGDKLVGYSVYATHRNLHYNDRVHAVQDVLFISPEYRRGSVGSRFIRWCDARLETMNVDLVSHHVKVKHDFSEILVKQGYQLVEYIYEKRLS